MSIVWFFKFHPPSPHRIYLSVLMSSIAPTVTSRQQTGSPNPIISPLLFPDSRLGARTGNSVPMISGEPLRLTRPASTNPGPVSPRPRVGSVRTSGRLNQTADTTARRTESRPRHPATAGRTPLHPCSRADLAWWCVGRGALGGDDEVCFDVPCKAAHVDDDMKTGRDALTTSFFFKRSPFKVGMLLREVQSPGPGSPSALTPGVPTQIPTGRCVSRCSHIVKEELMSQSRWLYRGVV